jgi:hypothetical protein
MNVAIFGVGLISKVAAAMFASVGNHVTVFHANKLERAYVNEPQLEKLYARQKESGRLIEGDNEENEQRDFDYILVADISLSSFFELFGTELENSLKKRGSVINLTPSAIGESQKIYNQYLSCLNIDETLKSEYKPICCVPLMVREGRSIILFLAVMIHFKLPV